MARNEEKNKEMRDNMRAKIIREASLYFAKNGFGDTKISELSKYIGIGQGTMYLYFKSKEELYDEIRKSASVDGEAAKLKMLSKMPIPAAEKIKLLSKYSVEALEKDEECPVRITLTTQLMLESEDPYGSELYKLTEKIIKQGQKEGTAVKGDALLLADMYWGMIYLFALKKLFAEGFKSPDPKMLTRILIMDGER